MVIVPFVAFLSAEKYLKIRFTTFKY